MRTYEVKPYGKKFATICRTDGYWSISWLSKTTRAARRKGDEFVSGKRTSTRRYRTRHGEMMDAVRAWERREAFFASLAD